MIDPILQAFLSKNCFCAVFEPKSLIAESATICLVWLSNILTANFSLFLYRKKRRIQVTKPEPLAQSYFFYKVLLSISMGAKLRYQDA